MNNKSLSNLTPRSFTSLGPTKVCRIPTMVTDEIITILSHLDRIHNENPDKMDKVLENLIDTLSEL